MVLEDSFNAGVYRGQSAAGLGVASRYAMLRRAPCWPVRQLRRRATA